MFFGSAQSSVSREMLEAELNMDLFVEFQSRAIETCRKRCINTDYKAGELSRGEAVCTDRCISKFFETSQIIQQLALQEMQRKTEVMKEM